VLTQTSETAIRALVYIVHTSDGTPITPKAMAEKLEVSPTYLAKIIGQLVKAGILRSQRGALGGVMLSRDPAQISLLEIVQASQGLIVANYCDEMSDHPEPVCSFHSAMKEARQAIVTVFTRWSLADLARRPGPSREDATGCKMRFFCKDGGIVCLGEKANIFVPSPPRNGRKRSAKS
jgi:Rrf2 family protein